MEPLMKSEIFFFISSIGTVLLVVLASILLFYLIKAGRNLYLLSQSLKSNYKESEEFIEELRERLEDNAVFQFFFPPARRKRSTTNKK
jgi:beta-lactamase regulating signal transducer with metallopeptidase domain